MTLNLFWYAQRGGYEVGVEQTEYSVFTEYRLAFEFSESLVAECSPPVSQANTNGIILKAFSQA